MARDITVTPEQLKRAASAIQRLADEYQELYNQLYQKTSEMATSWSGKDNVAFTNQIDGFKDDFKRMFDLMSQYSAFLSETAGYYEETQSAVVNEAKKLVN